MELQFQNKSLDCLRSILCSVKSQEQTQEMKLPEAMPDVAKVLGAWGQCVLRSKEWHNGRMSISGGVMAWVLYAPEDGSSPECWKDGYPISCIGNCRIPSGMVRFWCSRCFAEWMPGLPLPGS